MKAIRRFKAVLERHRSGHDGDYSPPSNVTGGNFDPVKERARAEEIEALIRQRHQFQRFQSKDEAIKNLALNLDRPEGGLPDAPDADVTDMEPLFLGVGAGGDKSSDEFAPLPDLHTSAVSESPTNADFNVYDKAYEDEVERILANPSRRPTMYLTRFVREKQQYQAVVNVVDGAAGQSQVTAPRTSGRFADAVRSMMDEAVPSKAKVTGQKRE